MAYVDYDYYINTYGGDRITADEAPRMFKDASKTVDSLTYCRINSDDMASLTPYQKGIVQEVVCSLAEWQKDNADLLDNPYSSYAINGVSASWGSGSGVRKINGCLIPSRVYANLVKTGLCYPGVM